MSGEFPLNSDIEEMPYSGSDVSETEPGEIMGKWRITNNNVGSLICHCFINIKINIMLNHSSKHLVVMDATFLKIRSKNSCPLLVIFKFAAFVVDL